MIARIKYTVKHHAHPFKKISIVFFLFGGLIVGLLYLLWIPLRYLKGPETWAIPEFMPDLFWHMHIIAVLVIAIGFGFRQLKWRTGKIELTEEKVIIQGSYKASIWLRNMWEIDVHDTQHQRWCIRLDSSTDAVLIKFKTEKEFENFSERLVQLVGQVENIKLKTTT